MSNYTPRIAENRIAEWRSEERRRPLLIKGPPRVGKTTLVENFARTDFKGDIVRIDFRTEKRVPRTLMESHDVERVLREISTLSGKKILPGQTLLFLDNIGSARPLLRTLRKLQEHAPAMHIVAADALIEHHLTELGLSSDAYAVLDLPPYSFAEFLLALGRREAAVIASSPPRRVEERMHKYLLDEVRAYLLVGGLPESVAAYAQSRSFAGSFAFQSEYYRDLLKLFATNFEKPQAELLDRVLRAIARKSGEKLAFTSLVDGESTARVKDAFDTVVGAGLAHRVPSINGDSPAKRHLKAVLFDVGILQMLCGVHQQIDQLPENPFLIHNGVLVRQFLGQEIRAAQEGKLSFWASSVKESNSRVDYLARVAGQIYPVIAIDGDPQLPLRSVDIYLDSYPESKQGFAFSVKPFTELYSHRCKHFPVYYGYSVTGGPPFR